MAKKQEVAVAPTSAVPAHLAQYQKTSVGNVDRSDRIMPRIKLLQGISPEVETYDNAKAGMWWHSMAEETLGDKDKPLAFVPIIIRKSYVLWAPRGDERGILARAMDGVHWDIKEGEFKVKPKNAGGKEVTWKMAPTVAESGLGEFGTSVPGDAQSAPAASLTYEILGWFPDFADFSPAVIINTRSAVKKAKQLISRIDMRPVAHYGQRYLANVVADTNGTDKFYNVNYTADGYADEALIAQTSELYESLKAANWAANDMTDEDTSGDGGKGQVGGKSGKF